MELEKKNGELFCRMKNLWVKVTESGFSVFSGGESYFEMMPGTSVSGEIKDIDEKALEYFQKSGNIGTPSASSPWGTRKM